MIYITINDVDVSLYVKPTTLRIALRSTSGPATASFTIENYSSSLQSGHDVRIYVDSTSQMLFGGTVASITQSYMAPNEMTRYQIECTDYRHLFDRKLVTEHYANDYMEFDVTIDSIIDDIITNYTDPALSFTMNNVRAFTRIIDFNFNYRYPSDCLREMAETFNCEWYIDEDKDIHFFLKETTFAPFEINDTNMVEYGISNFSIMRTNNQIRNRIYVQGGYTTSDSQSVHFTGDGSARYWALPYKPHDISLTVGGASKTIGQENVDEGSYDYWYNFYEKTLFCDTGEATPGVGVDIHVTMKFEYPLLVQVDDEDSQSLLASIETGDGIYEYVVRDNNLETKDQAENYGYRELEQRGKPLVEGAFSYSDYYGFKPGQSVVINLTDCNCNGTYTIKRVTVDDYGNNILSYNVEFEGVIDNVG